MRTSTDMLEREIAVFSTSRTSSVLGLGMQEETRSLSLGCSRTFGYEHFLQEKGSP